MFASAAPLASTFAGALAYGITSGHSTLSNWRLLFLVEGLPTILLAPIAFFFIPDSPDHARFLNVEEKAIAKSRAIRQAGTSKRIGGLNLKQLFQTLYDAKAWCYAVCSSVPRSKHPSWFFFLRSNTSRTDRCLKCMYFSVNVSYASLPVYLPTILAKMGYSSINAQGLSAPPYFAAYLFANITTFIADRTQQRGLVLIITSLVGGIGYIVLATVTTVGVRYFAVYLAAAGVFSTIPNILAWTLSTSTKLLNRVSILLFFRKTGKSNADSNNYQTTKAAIPAVALALSSLMSSDSVDQS